MQYVSGGRALFHPKSVFGTGAFRRLAKSTLAATETGVHQGDMVLGVISYWPRPRPPDT